LPGGTPGQNLDYRRQEWFLRELLCFYDRQFVQNAYLVLLKRDCDAEGLESRLTMLQSGALSRVELLFRLRYGPEGKQHGTRVRGLLRAFLVDKLCRTPVIGWVPRYLRALLRLPAMQRDVEEMRGLIAMQKNDSDDRDRMIVEFQNAELDKLRRRLGR
jgi:O-antigen chain-terminating methyltransferase